VAKAKREKKLRKAFKREVNLPIKLPKNKLGEKLGKKRKIKAPWPLGPIFRYISNSRKELKQVEWPNRKETWKLTFAVAMFTIVFMIIIALTDLGFSKLIERILL
jgi:preprotein translocase SecE subunit